MFKNVFKNPILLLCGQTLAISLDISTKLPIPTHSSIPLSTCTPGYIPSNASLCLSASSPSSSRSPDPISTENSTTSFIGPTSTASSIFSCLSGSATGYENYMSCYSPSYVCPTGWTINSLGLCLPDPTATRSSSSTCAPGSSINYVGSCIPMATSITPNATSIRTSVATTGTGTGISHCPTGYLDKETCVSTSGGPWSNTTALSDPSGTETSSTYSYRRSTRSRTTYQAPSFTISFTSLTKTKTKTKTIGTTNAVTVTSSPSFTRSRPTSSLSWSTKRTSEGSVTSTSTTSRSVSPTSVLSQSGYDK